MKAITNDTLTLMAEFGRVMRSQLRSDASYPSLSQLEALQFVSEHESPLMRDLALYLKVKAPSATSLVNELVRARMLTRRGDPNDRRQVRLGVTPRGTELLSQMFEKKKKIIGSMLQKLNAEDRQKLNELLQKVFTA